MITALETLGYPTDDILTEVGIARTVLEDAEGRIPHTTMMHLWQHALAVTDDQDLGIYLAEAAPVQSFESTAMRSYPAQRSVKHTVVPVVTNA